MNKKHINLAYLLNMQDKRIKLKRLIMQGSFNKKERLANSQLNAFQIGQNQLDLHFKFDQIKLAKYATSYINKRSIGTILQKNLDSQFKLKEFGLRGSRIVVILEKKGLQDSQANKAYKVFLQLLKVVQQALETSKRLAKV